MALSVYYAERGRGIVTAPNLLRKPVLFQHADPFSMTSEPAVDSLNHTFTRKPSANGKQNSEIHMTHKMQDPGQSLRIHQISPLVTMSRRTSFSVQKRHL